VTRSHLVQRLLQACLVIILVSMVTFALSHLGGDPAQLMAGPNASAQQVHRLSVALGLDRSIPRQYLSFAGNALQGDLGTSLTYRLSVASLVTDRLGATVELGLAAMGFATGLGIPLGIIAAWRRGGILDAGARFLSVLGQSVPVFWLGLLLILVFAVNWKVLPASGRTGPSSVILPAIALGLYPLAQIASVTRATMIDVLRQDYMRTAVVKGLSSTRVLLVHALRNVLVPVVTVIGLQLGAVFGGAIIVETVFAWPGVGSLSVQAVYAHDYPLVQGVVLFVSVVFVLVNLATDMFYTLLDPRIHYRAE
jgi:peptide/nickel transport system permease protein